MKPSNGLDKVVVTLFERNGKPYIRMVFYAFDGTKCDVDTELDCRQFTIHFTDDEPKQLPGKGNAKLN